MNVVREFRDELKASRERLQIAQYGVPRHLAPETSGASIPAIGMALAGWIVLSLIALGLYGLGLVLVP